MARKTTAVEVAAPPAPGEAKAAAVARVIARRRAPEYSEIPDHRTGGVFRFQRDPGSEFAAAASLGEWLDDRVARCTPAAGASNVLIGLLERLRGGVDAVPGAVAFAAGQLNDPHQQWGVFMVLNGLPGGPNPVDTVRAAITREWRERGLQDRPPPAPPFGAEPMDRNSLPPLGRVRYRTPLGQNAA